MKTAPDDVKAPRVFVVEQQPFDYSPATTFGEVCFIDAQKLGPDPPSAPNTWNRSVVQQIRKQLADYIPGYDYVIPTGQPSRMMLAGMLLAEKGKNHKLLGWDSRTQRYLEFTVQL